MESFPTDIRSSDVGFAKAISRLGSASTFLFPSMATKYNALGTLMSFAWAQETKALSLSDASNVSE
ncbi:MULTISPECIES: hypothetical protein [Lysinibacillus]|uniref:hypothetical protein n=1 Tax=Lysinibacillus TaxID=400634 RepID=UPI00257F9751|nr:MULTISPECIES: hypothetical protein [Lysinibacillus]